MAVCAPCGSACRLRRMHTMHNTALHKIQVSPSRLHRRLVTATPCCIQAFLVAWPLPTQNAAPPCHDSCSCPVEWQRTKRVLVVVGCADGAAWRCDQSPAGAAIAPYAILSAPCSPQHCVFVPTSSAGCDLQTPRLEKRCIVSMCNG